MNNYTSYSSILDFTFSNIAEKRYWNKKAKGMKDPRLVVFDPKSFGEDGEIIPVEVIDRADFAEENYFRADAYSQAIFNIEDNFYRNFFLPAYSM